WPGVRFRRLHATRRCSVEPVTGYATSPDGTRIGFERSGEGPPLVLVHGTSADRTRWAGVLPAFTGRFTVYAEIGRASGRARDWSSDVCSSDLGRVYDFAGCMPRGGVPWNQSPVTPHRPTAPGSALNAAAKGRPSYWSTGQAPTGHDGPASFPRSQDALRCTR